MMKKGLFKFLSSVFNGVGAASLLLQTANASESGALPPEIDGAQLNDVVTFDISLN